MIVHRITTVDLPELELYRTLRENTQHWRRGMFIAEGDKCVLRLIESRLPVQSFLLSEEWFSELETTLSDELYGDTEVYVGSEKLLDSIVGFRMHKRIMAMAPIPASPPLERLAYAPHGSNVHVAVEGIADSENMGTMIRSFDALGAGSMIAGNDSSNPWLRRSVRVSMGSVFSLPVYSVPDVLATVEKCKKLFNWHVVATLPEGGRPRMNVPADRPLCLLIGSEAHGLTGEALALADTVYTIPMHGGVESLNVATAAAIALYEAVRR